MTRPEIANLLPPEPRGRRRRPKSPATTRGYHLWTRGYQPAPTRAPRWSTRANMARSRPRGRNGGVVLGVVTVAAAFFSIPFAAHYAKRDNLHTTPKALNATQVRRGAYLNTGSKDAGADPDWDTDSHTYRGRERRRQQQLRQREKEANAQRDDE